MQPLKFKTMTACRQSLLFLVFMGVVCLCAACNREEFSNRTVIAAVNGENIYLDEFEKRLAVQKKAFFPQGLPDSPGKRELLEEEILESMITEKIVLQRARALNMSVSNTDLERKLLDLRKDYGENFFDLLAAQNVSYEEWREELRKEMLFDKLVATDVNAVIRVSEDEALDAYEENPEFCKTEARVRAGQIVVRDMARAKEAETRLSGGDAFEKVAAEMSIGPESARGGDLGWVARRIMPDPLDRMLFTLPVGKISPIIRSDYGYHIVRVLEKQPARTRDFSECRKDLIADIRARKEDAAFNVWLNDLKIKALVRKDPGVLKTKKRN
ncbi:MAG: peptidyl-prolyl cis-trans isomerase [Deltaproteobacteria bacterium]